MRSISLEESTEIRIAIVKDHEIFRVALTSFLNKEENLNVVHSAVNGAELIHYLGGGQQVDVIILDLDMPIMDGNKALSIIRKTYGESIGVIILSMHNGPRHLKKYMHAGANAFLDKDCAAEVLLEAITAANKKEIYFSPDISRRLIREIQESESIDDAILKEEPLTEREVEICQLLCQGMTCPIIANQLNRSIRTIENHKSHIFKKFGVGSCTEMMAVAIRRNHFQINI